ncbi:helix-turn-helix domain-containing protein, partial [Rhodococcus sp. EPR-157]|uniref:helix-turn-helix domain-containing protein n=1 Tax=Rhodococcus sp. EPR-157 TaxID=1813677 RepID=UPI000AEB249C
TEPGEHERSSHFRKLALQPVTRVDLPPLRERLDRIPSLVRSIAATVGEAGDGLRFTPGALSALARRRWTGNISELREVVATAIRRRSAGDITEHDIDSSHTGSDLRLTRLELAERATIESVLSQCGGNKSEAAVELGISRTTLYKRMRAFGMPG